MQFRLQCIDRRGGGMKTGRLSAFTMLEIMVALVLLVIIMVVTASLVDSSSRVWRQANAKIESFQAARGAFDLMTARISQATLNTYWDYYDAGYSPYRLVSDPTSFVAKQYGRYSDLHFVCGQSSDLVDTLPSDLSATSTQAVFFATPTGLTANPSYRGLAGLLSVCGYFVAYGKDDALKPGILNTSPPVYRWRLVEVSDAVENLAVFSASSGTSWFTQPIQDGHVRPLAENIIALVLWPKKSAQEDPEGDDLSDNYAYDSRTQAAWVGTPPRQPVQAHQLPPTLQLTMVAIDETSAKRMANTPAAPAEVGNALAGLFTGKVADYDDDLAELQKRLAGSRIQYHVFSTSVALKESKWSP